MTHTKLTKRWVDYGKEHLEGRTVKTVRYLTEEEIKNLGWNSSAIVVELDNGTLIFPSTDDEGNNAGALFGQTQDGEPLTFPVL